MHKKIRVGVLFGGKSFEHEVSLLSAKNVIDAIDPDKYEVVLIGIDKNGEWHLRENQHYLADAHHPKLVQFTGSKEPIAVVPKEEGKQFVSLSKKGPLGSLDVIFPVLHGPNGEDGTVQGLLKLADIPFVGAGVLGSAVGMDKDVMKRLLRDAGIPTAKFVSILSHQAHLFPFEKLEKELGLPFFVKPSNAGSSIGISKVKKKEDYKAAIESAFEYDRKILVEEFVEGREIECSVLGNEHPIVSLPGEVITETTEFYSYEAKYVEGSGAIFKLPVELPPDLLSKVQTISREAYQVLCCEGMARVDLFLKKNGDVVVNELNTIPGFTKLSPFPQLWEASGIPFPELVDRLIELALDRHKKEKQVKTSFANLESIQTK
ncbi:MAG TPA: D-alanine--D-alanine ligase [Rhabdochlamydiaceae bacterium]|nr:D-alanine--D-alanine ligase [Rhabdochlamydiaceae bacterium]